MDRNKSIAKNTILNAIKTTLSIIFPLITYPYVTRVLHAVNLGKVTYAQSIVSYFALIAALGVNTYAVRQGAKLINDPKKLGIFCSEIFTTNIITTIISYLLLIACVFALPKLQEYSCLIFILSTSICLTTIGVEWINVIFEDYWIITIRSIVVQLINIVLLFFVVKTENDYYRYACLIVLTSGIVGLWNFIYCRRYVKIKITLHPNFTYHIKPLLVFFASNLAISVYCYADTTMIGLMIDDKAVGIYSVAVKAYTVIKTLLASIYTVCIPRLAIYFGKNERDRFSELVNNVLSCLILILLPAMIGIIVLAEPIVLFLGGTEYLAAVPTLRILSLALLFAIVGGVFSNCINIPIGKEKVTLVGTVVAALLNIILNLAFIPGFGQIGAAITTVIAEASVVIVCFVGNIEIRKLVNWKVFFINAMHALLGCIGILVGYFVAIRVTNNAFMVCGITIICTIALYSVILFALKNRYFFEAIRKVHCFFTRWTTKRK